MSPSFSYQRHTPGRVPFEETFSWQERPNLSSIVTLSEQCLLVDGCRNLDQGLLLEAQAGQARAWLEDQGRAYVQLGPNQLELLIHPDWRGRGWGQWLLEAGLRSFSGSHLDIWSYGDSPRVWAWLERQNFRSQRLLYCMRREIEPPDEPEWPQGWQVACFREGDLASWHELHVRLQSDPTRAWSQQRLLRQLQQPETPPQSFWLLWEGGQLRGYLWLKEDEIFLFALDPGSRGCGLGRRLLQFGLSRCKQGWGYCDDRHPQVLELYRKLGMVEVGRDRCLRRSM